LVNLQQLEEKSDSVRGDGETKEVLNCEPDDAHCLKIAEESEIDIRNIEALRVRTPITDAAPI